ncbi:hypothetical protein ALC62_04372 [Cyphomyrmex costatus]|uniref:Uncharacterized protein n=1 Tax=Cyphomyrmex costatus TaxID=456900 RepID=A0A195CVN4_9HYME|nr:hypothetical protein ALC62_04372 [Cyphomyrmex costatus]
MRRWRILNISQSRVSPHHETARATKRIFPFCLAEIDGDRLTILEYNSKKVFWPRNAQDIPTSVNSLEAL